MNRPAVYPTDYRLYSVRVIEEKVFVVFAASADAAQEMAFESRDDLTPFRVGALEPELLRGKKIPPGWPQGSRVYVGRPQESEEPTLSVARRWDNSRGRVRNETKEPA